LLGQAAGQQVYGLVQLPDLSVAFCRRGCESLCHGLLLRNALAHYVDGGRQGAEFALGTGQAFCHAHAAEGADQFRVLANRLQMLRHPVE
jgi:hypothetical protein